MPPINALPPKKQQGFTLLELLIVLAIIGILASLAITRYQSHIVGSNRQAAVAGLQMAQQALEREFLSTSSYAGFSQSKLEAVTNNLIHTGSSHTFVLTSLSNTAYVITAQPSPSMPDVTCGSLSIDQTGVRTKSGTASDVAECW